MADRPVLPNWPRVMNAKMAAAYLSMGVKAFQSIGIVPIETNGRRLVYDRRSLDLYIDRLSGTIDHTTELDERLVRFGLESDLDERLMRFGAR